MKKFWIILSVSIVLILVILVIIANSSSKDNFLQKSYSPEEDIYALSIDVDDREIEVSKSSDGKIHIDYYESEKEYYNFSYNDNELTISLVYNKSWLDYFRIKSSKSYRKIYLSIPNNLLNRLQITTTNEAIKLNDIMVNETLTLNSNGGNLEFDNTLADNQINLTAKNGNIIGTIQGTWDDFSISCKYKKGTCNLPENKAGGTKSLNVNCNNGNIKIDFVD